MKRLHVHLKVKELIPSIRFYSTLFDAPPTLQKPEYAQWMLDDPRVNFSIAESSKKNDGDGNGIAHLGIQAETEQELLDLRHRIGTMKGEVFEEGETICCYHASDKTWITDAQGISWEAFFTSGEAASMSSPTSPLGDDCCAASCCA